MAMLLVAQASVVSASDDCNCNKSSATRETSIPSDPISEEADLESIKQAIEKSGANWVAGETSVSGLSPYDRRRLCGLKEFSGTSDEMTTEEILKSPTEMPPVGAHPPVFDWRNKDGGDWTTPIKDQASCGSCWAFGSLAAVEAQYNIEKGNPDMDIDLSEQEMVSCSPGDCGGWHIPGTMNWLRDNGTVYESCFPYEASDAPPCDDHCSDWWRNVWKIEGWGSVSSSIDAIKERLLDAPLPTGMTVYTDFWSYSGGVYEHTSGSVEGGHLVTIVGWNDTEGCWICKNSWGTDWGEDTYGLSGETGWFRIKYGECGIEDNTVYITDVQPPDSGSLGGYITKHSYNAAADGGNITQLNITIEKTLTTNWQGLYGTISSEGIGLSDASEVDVFRWGEWDNSTDFGYVLATTNPSTPDWESLTTATSAEIDTAWNFTIYDADSAHNTCNNSNNTEITIGFNTIAADTTANVSTYDGNQALTWETIMLRHPGTVSENDHGLFVFVGVNDRVADRTSFNGEPCDYQMLVPVNTTTTYYLYTELRTS